MNTLDPFEDVDNNLIKLYENISYIEEGREKTPFRVMMETVSNLDFLNTELLHVCYSNKIDESLLKEKISLSTRLLSHINSLFVDIINTWYENDALSAEKKATVLCASIDNSFFLKNYPTSTPKDNNHKVALEKIKLCFIGFGLILKDINNYCPTFEPKTKLELSIQDISNSKKSDTRFKNPKTNHEIAYAIFELFHPILHNSGLNKEERIMLFDYITGRSGKAIYNEYTGKNLTVNKKNEIANKLISISEKIKHALK